MLKILIISCMFFSECYASSFNLICGTDPGSIFYWKNGDGPGSEYYWNHGDRAGSRYFWDHGATKGSKYYWLNGDQSGSGFYWKKGDDYGSNYYWENGSGPGSKFYWQKGDQASFDPVMTSLCFSSAVILPFCATGGLPSNNDLKLLCMNKYINKVQSVNTHLNKVNSSCNSIR